MTPPGNNDPHHHLRIFYSMKDVCVITGYSRTHIYRMERAGAFPRRRKLGLNKIGFLKSEVDAWASNRPIPDLLCEPDLELRAV